MPQRPEEEEGGAPSDSLLSELEIKAAKTRAERNLLVKLQAQLKKEDEEIEATRSTLSQDKAEIRALRAKLKPLEVRRGGEGVGSTSGADEGLGRFLTWRVGVAVGCCRRGWRPTSS